MKILCFIVFSTLLFCATVTDNSLSQQVIDDNCRLFVDLHLVGYGVERRVEKAVFEGIDEFCPSEINAGVASRKTLRIEGVVSGQEFQPVKQTSFGQMGVKDNSRRNFIAGDFIFSTPQREEEFISLEVWGLAEYKSFNELIEEFVRDLRKEIGKRK